MAKFLHHNPWTNSMRVPILLVLMEIISVEIDVAVFYFLMCRPLNEQFHIGRQFLFLCVGMNVGI